MNKEQTAIYSRHLLLSDFGREAQQRLLGAKVCVVGCGGLGCALLPYLVAAGTGEVTIIDQGEVELSNIQRQILYAKADVGSKKTEVAAAYLRRLGAGSVILPCELWLTPDNIVEAVSVESDLVVDCTDNFAVRYLLADYCWKNRIPLISAAVLEFDGHIMSMVRAGDNPCLRCLMPEEPVVYNKAKDVGVFGPAVGVMGTLQAVEAVKLLSGVGSGLESSFLSFNFLSMRVTKMQRERNPECGFCSHCE